MVLRLCCALFLAGLVSPMIGCEGNSAKDKDPNPELGKNSPAPKRGAIPSAGGDNKMK